MASVPQPTLGLVFGLVFEVSHKDFEKVNIDEAMSSVCPSVRVSVCLSVHLLSVR